MYDWRDDFYWQACMSFPTLRSYIGAAYDYNESLDSLLDFLLNIESKSGTA